MLKIKLARFGKRNQPHYRVVVAEARSKRDSGYVANLGHYAPTQTPKLLKIDLESYKSWLTKGAQPTDTVLNLVQRLESGTPFPAKTAKPSKKSRAKSAEEANAKAEAEAKPEVVEETAPPEEAETKEGDS